MKGNALPARRKKTPEGRVYRFKTGQGESFPAAISAHTGFFEVNRINYNYYDHHSPSVSGLYRRVM